MIWRGWLAASAAALLIHPADGIARPDPTTHATPRSSSAARAFRRAHPCPSTGRAVGACPGWIIDHIWPLACGGADTPQNMQWQALSDARSKDRWERRACPP